MERRGWIYGEITDEIENEMEWEREMILKRSKISL